MLLRYSQIYTLYSTDLWRNQSLVLIYWTFSLRFPRGDVRHSWFSLWTVESPLLGITVLVPFFSFLLFPSHMREEASWPAVSTGLVFDLVMLGVTWLSLLQQICFCPDDWWFLEVSATDAQVKSHGVLSEGQIRKWLFKHLSYYLIVQTTVYYSLLYYIYYVVYCFFCIIFLCKYRQTLSLLNHIIY